jgi:hypothetical protein
LARDRKVEVAAVNVRIPATETRNYVALFEDIARTKKSVRVRGDTFVAIKSFDGETGRGIIAKFTEIDIDGDWFDLEAFDAATPDKVEGIEIPNTLRPNLSQFYFTVEPNDHIVVFEVYSESKGLSPRSFEKFLKSVVVDRSISKKYGVVEADLIKDYGAIERILDLPHLRELTIVIRPPNSDDVGKHLAKVIEERLQEQNGGEYEERIKALPNRDLEPNERTRRLALIGAENGEVEGKALQNRILTRVGTTEAPLIEGSKFGEDTSAIAVFHALANRIVAKIRAKRRQVRE